jgi:hypothetical protein
MTKKIIILFTFIAGLALFMSARAQDDQYAILSGMIVNQTNEKLGFSDKDSVGIWRKTPSSPLKPNNNIYVITGEPNPNDLGSNAITAFLNVIQYGANNKPTGAYCRAGVIVDHTYNFQYAMECYGDIHGYLKQCYVDDQTQHIYDCSVVITG